MDLPPGARWDALRAPLVAWLGPHATDANPITVRAVRDVGGVAVLGHVQCDSPLSRYRCACTPHEVRHPADRKAALTRFFVALGFPVITLLTWWQLCALLHDFHELDSTWLPWSVRGEAERPVELAAQGKPLPQLQQSDGAAALTFEREWVHAPHPAGPGVGLGGGVTRPTRQRATLHFGSDGAWSVTQQELIRHFAPEGLWRAALPQWAP